MRPTDRFLSLLGPIIGTLLTGIVAALPIRWWEALPSRLQVLLAALGWSLTFAMSCLYYLLRRLTLDDLGILRDRNGKPHCPGCRCGLIVEDANMYTCVKCGRQIAPGERTFRSV